MLPLAICSQAANADSGVCRDLFLETKPASRVEIEITNQKLFGFRDETSETLRIPIVNIRHGRQIIQLKDLEPLAISDDAQVVVFTSEADGSRRHLDVPVWVRERLRDYIRIGGPPADPFDCICFASWMNGKPFKFGPFDKKAWDIERTFGEDSVEPGDTILIGFSPDEVNHVAIYLGDGFYVSKFGIGGPVLITSYPTLQLVYGGFLFARARPSGEKVDANQTPLP